MDEKRLFRTGDQAPKPGKNPDQLDHVFADERTKNSARSWRVVPDPVKVDPLLSDHAPIEVVLDPQDGGS